MVRAERGYAVETAQCGPDCSAAALVDTAHTSGSFRRSVRPSLMYWGRGPCSLDPTDSTTKPSLCSCHPAHWILPTVPPNPVLLPPCSLDPTDSTTKPSVRAILHLCLCRSTSCFLWSKATCSPRSFDCPNIVNFEVCHSLLPSAPPLSLYNSLQFHTPAKLQAVLLRKIRLWAMPSPGRLLAGLSTGRRGFSFIFVRVGFVVGKVTLGQVFSPVSIILPAAFSFVHLSAQRQRPEITAKS